jgi:hypothetical protein
LVALTIPVIVAFRIDSADVGNAEPRAAIRPYCCDNDPIAGDVDFRPLLEGTFQTFDE